MTTPPNPQGIAPATTIIDKRGDVILHVDGDKETAVSLLVSSQVLSLASSVFEAMLDGRFAEGQNLSPSSPPTIPCPEDDPETMAMLCKLIHMQTYDIPATLSIVALVDFAVLCDKYNSVNGVRPWSKIWVSHFLSTPETCGFYKLLFVSYALDLPHEFRQISLSLICHNKGLDKLSFAVHGHEYLPLNIVQRLQNDQSNFQDQAAAAIMPKDLMALLGSGCEKANTFTIAFFRNLHRANLMPPQYLSLAEYHKRAKDFDSMEPSWKSCAGGFCYCGNVNKHNIKSSVYTEVDIIFNSIPIYCLDCIYNEAKGTPGSPCRVPHP